MFRDRLEAGEKLAAALEKYRGRRDAVVLAVPRGGLPVGAVVAQALGLPLDVMLTKKIGHPQNPELAVGAVALSGEVIGPLARQYAVPESYLLERIEAVRAELRRRRARYAGDSEPVAVEGKTVLLVDDGAATGMTLRVAAAALKNAGAARVVIAVPVAPEEAVAVLRPRADEVVCLECPDDFRAVGQYYADFTEVDDEQAAGLLRSFTPARSIS
jgi:putative phosphoribosyl transferase